MQALTALICVGDVKCLAPTCFRPSRPSRSFVRCCWGSRSMTGSMSGRYATWKEWKKAIARLRRCVLARSCRSGFSTLSSATSAKSNTVSNLLLPPLLLWLLLLVLLMACAPSRHRVRLASATDWPAEQLSVWTVVVKISSRACRVPGAVEPVFQRPWCLATS